MSEDFQRAMALADVPEGGMRACTLDGREIVVCRTKQGLFAVDNICSHAHARMCEGRLRGSRLICPLHGASFDVRDGRVLGAPATRPLVSHEVRVHGDAIEVRVNAAPPRQLTI